MLVTPTNESTLYQGFGLFSVKLQLQDWMDDHGSLVVSQLIQILHSSSIENSASFHENRERIIYTVVIWIQASKLEWEACRRGTKRKNLARTGKQAHNP